MASTSDQVAFLESVDDQSTQNLFQTKKWTYVTDSSSNGGVFNSQIQFDLNTLSSQSDWVDLSQGVIQFPVKLSIKNNSANAPGQITVNSALIKNGFHQFIDSVQVVLGGNTIQSSQIFTNIDTNYKILTEWSQDELAKYGPSLGIALDQINGSTDTDIGFNESLDNSALVTSIGGFDMVKAKNSGTKQRMLYNNNSTGTSLGKSILGANQSLLGKSNVSIGISAISGEDTFVQFYLATVRLKDVCDSLSKLPLCKSLKGFIYVNYNSSKHIISNAGTSAITSVSNTATYGRCAPAQLNLGIDGLTLSNSATAPVTFTAEVSALPSVTLPTAQPTYTNARLIVPYYVATPEIDRSLTQKKTFRYNERFVTQFSIAPNGNYQGTLSPGVTNAKRLIMFPYFTGAGNSGNSGFIDNPLLSALDSVPSTTSPFAALKDLQVNVGNQPMFQSPITCDYDTFLNEVAQQGKDGGLVSDSGSGLLNQLLWNQLYRYYTVDIGRRLNSEDGCSKSVQVSCTNATTCPMTVIAIIWYEKEITIDTASGTIMQKM